ncbi:hypothetical protein DEDE109153_08625 [Deinococcus deserti]
MGYVSLRLPSTAPLSEKGLAGGYPKNLFPAFTPMEQIVPSCEGMQQASAHRLRGLMSGQNDVTVLRGAIQRLQLIDRVESKDV